MSNWQKLHSLHNTLLWRPDLLDLSAHHLRHALGSALLPRHVASSSILDDSSTLGCIVLTDTDSFASTPCHSISQCVHPKL